MKKVTQQHAFGCAVACVASLCRISYKQALRLFSNKSAASFKGYYCREICNALQRKGKQYCYGRISAKTRKNLQRIGTIVFISRSRKYPAGHYLLRTERGWMNPWINFPQMNPARSGFQKRLPGRVQLVIYKQ